MGDLTDLPRLVVYNRFGAYVKELSPNDVFSAIRHAEINGEDSLTIKTSDVLAKGQHIVYRDKMLIWHEYIVTGTDDEHDSGRSSIGTYYCENSWGELRTCPYIIDLRPGLQSPVSAQYALQQALQGTRWSVGDVDLTTANGTSWYHISPWEAITDIVEKWGGQLRADITVDDSGVVSRKLSLLQSIGSGPGVRFDFGSDVTDIKATYDEDDIYTALYCYGKGVESGNGYGRKIGIESVNNGVPYVEDTTAKQIWGQIGSNGQIDNSYGIFEDGECEDPSTLMTEGQEALKDASRPKAQYSATVVQFERAGTGLRGAALGDPVDVVDRNFYLARGVDADLRLSGSIVAIDEDLVNEDSTSITLGDLMQTIADDIAGLSNNVHKLTAAAPTWNGVASGASAYLDDLIDNLNTQINASGGYTYIKPGQGIWVYDKAEDQNPTKVINLMGGAMRIADSKNSAGEWDWQSVFVSGHVASELITAVQITAGFIGSPSGGNYWNLDTGEFRLANTATINGKGIATTDAVIESVDVEYAVGTSNTTPPTSGWASSSPQWSEGSYIWQRTKTVAQDGTASYSDPVCIQGAAGQNGNQGDQGIGVSAIVEQYYLSTSSTTQTGGSWSTNQPAWSTGHYIWTRSQVTWTNNSTTYTDPVLAQAINGANQSAQNANTTAQTANNNVNALDDSLNQQGIFNRLTNNGQTQGIYLSNGKLYINADYIQSGTLSAVAIRVTQGNNIIYIDNTNGFKITSSGSTIAQVNNGMFYGGRMGTPNGYVSIEPSGGYGAMSYVQNGVEALRATPYAVNGSRGGLYLYANSDLFIDVDNNDTIYQTSTTIHAPKRGATLRLSGNNTADLNMNDNRTHLNMGSGYVEIWADTTHYIDINASSNKALVRCGSTAFGYYNGQYSTNWQF